MKSYIVSLEIALDDEFQLNYPSLSSSIKRVAVHAVQNAKFTQALHGVEQVFDDGMKVVLNVTEVP